MSSSDVCSTLGSRDALAKTPPHFPETSSRPALILGDSGWSKQDLGFEESGKLTTFPNEFPESRVRPLRSEIWAENGQFCHNGTSGKTAHTRPSRNTPFSRTPCCSIAIVDQSGDSGHNPGLDGRRKVPFHCPFMNDFSAEENVAPELGWKADNRRFGC
jgi:hypothetical protein